MLAVKAEEKLNKEKQMLIEALGSPVPAVENTDGDKLEPEEDAIMSLGDASAPFVPNLDDAS
eukprot:5221200-Pleurochrysis_carterae.AAC.1